MDQKIIDELIEAILASPDYVKENVLCYFYHNTSNCTKCPIKADCIKFKQ